MSSMGVGDGGPIRLALIDDHELVREGLRALIDANASSELEIVYSGPSVIEAVDARPGVAVLDVELGAESAGVGDNVTRLTSAGINVLLISAFDDPVAVRSGMHAGALGFTPKRVSYDTLIEALRSIGAGTLYLSVDLASILATAKDAPDLSPRELDALRLYASGLKLTAVAHRMGISPYTAKEYLDRVRAKYENVGRPARTRTELYAAASRDGLIDRDDPRS